MNVAKLNPIGYEAKTEKGNTYKKSNLGTTAMLLTTAAIDGAAFVKKGNIISQCLSMGEGLPALFPNVKGKGAMALRALGIAFDVIGIGWWAGRSIDKAINKKRIAKADEPAVAVDNK